MSRSTKNVCTPVMDKAYLTLPRNVYIGRVPSIRIPTGNLIMEKEQSISQIPTRTNENRELSLVKEYSF